MAVWAAPATFNGCVQAFLRDDVAEASRMLKALNLNKPDQDGSTAVFYAVLYPHILATFLRQGADPSVKKSCRSANSTSCCC